ncbi:MAG: hypothetical protein C0613_07750 [Desulfobulbaceae bacterium]|nr:MAG: hypothetical protein C0613_07750 [Desulfobulbaceae bacterium]
MKQIVNSQTAPYTSCRTCRCTTCPHLDLCGSCVLYVGGQHSLIRHYRQMVERSGGRFIHHDGGREDKRAKLAKMMGRADAVICPTNHVSHDACLRAKRHCKLQNKPFIAMRSAGVSALARGLAYLATDQGKKE